MRKQLARASNTRLFGVRQEYLASKYLQQRGLRLLQRNYQCRLGEIDLIMLDAGNVLVFVEIRFRSQSGFGTAIESIDHRKQQKIRRTASYYLLHNPKQAQLACRFDVVGITPNPDDSAVHLEWIQNAFS